MLWYVDVCLQIEFSRQKFKFISLQIQNFTLEFSSRKFKKVNKFECLRQNKSAAHISSSQIWIFALKLVNLAHLKVNNFEFSRQNKSAGGVLFSSKQI